MDGFTKQIGRARVLLDSTSMAALSSSCSTVVLLCVAIPTLALAQAKPAPKHERGHPHEVAGDPAAVFASLDEETRRALALQVALDRAGFSPGEIDGKPGKNTEQAAAAHAAGGAAVAPVAQPLTIYTLTAEDAAGPFIPVPEDMMAKSKLPSLGYASLLEMIAERFHASPTLLKQLNGGARFDAGDAIVVPDVEPFVVSPAPGGEKTAASAETAKASKPAPRGAKPAVKDAFTLTVTERTSTLQLIDSTGAVVFHAPVTVGSTHDPLPVGEWKVTGVSRYPSFHYNPALFWDADPTHAKATLPPGPNNPVGVVWIDLSKEHYGIHGSPEPSRIAYSESHGCIRLTNWDVMRLAGLVSSGTKVVLR